MLTTQTDSGSQVKMADRIGIAQSERQRLDSPKSNTENDVEKAHIQNYFEEQDQTASETGDQSSSKVANLLMSCRGCLTQTYSSNRTVFVALLKCAFFVAFCVYLGVAFKHSFGDKESVTLLGVACAIFLIIAYVLVSKLCGHRIKNSLSTISTPRQSKRRSKVYWAAVSILMAVLLGYVFVDTAIKRPRNLVSGLGVVVFVLFMFALSKNPAKVRWRSVVWGFLLQFVFGLLVLRTEWGYLSFKWLADRVTEYLNHTDAGAAFVFGATFGDHFFAFRVLTTIIVVSTTVSILYYLGVMQVAINAITKLMRVSLDTGPMETLHAAFNIFLGWAETIPVVQPLLQDMTLSELHAIMTNGFSTVSGGAMAAYILYGAPANHLISASFMSAPAALAMGKLFYPETVPGRRKQKAPVIPKSDHGVIEAASAGAVSSIPLIAYILVHVIAFLSLLDFVNDTLAWLGARVGVAPPEYPKLSFQYISSYVLWPVAFLMGVETSDCRVVARMLGVKVFVNEFLAFADLGQVRKNNDIMRNYTSFFPNSTWDWTPTDDIRLNETGLILPGGIISERSATIATYALCGFSDLVALGMMVGALSAVAAGRKRDIIRVAPRALVSGVMACFLTACMAGLLVE